MQRAADVLVKVLISEDVGRVFCVPGESYLSVLDALCDQGGVEVIACRHEASACHAAEAHAKFTGKVGVCLVTRGPGAMQAAIGVHTAQQDSTPLILFIGQVALADKHREAFQEMDYGQVFGSVAKWVAEVPSAGRMGEYVERAFRIARAGRPGPVVLALPEEVLDGACPNGPIAAPDAHPPAIAPEFLETLRARLAGAQRPILVLGGSGWTPQACNEIAQFAEANALPTALSFRRKHLMDNESPVYVGDLGLGPNPALVQAVREADLILAVGARLGENPTQGYTLLSRADTAEKLIHIHADGAEIGRVWPVCLGAVAGTQAAARALSAVRVEGRWAQWTQKLRASYEAFSSPIPVGGAVNLSEVFAHLRAALPADAVVCNGAGNYAAWLHRFYRHRGFATQLGPISGAMGYGVPAALAAKLAAPAREVFAIAGDGCFLMAAHELATAQQYGAGFIVLVVDNGGFGTIRMHQARRFPGRVSATTLQNPDFVSYANSFGAWAQRVERTEDFPAALASARACGGLALLHLVTSLDDIAPGQSLRAIEKV